MPLLDTLTEVNALHKQGLFTQFGLSNFAAWEVARVVELCRANGLVQPTIYQAMYNAITRSAEEELIPCCRAYGLRIVVYNPLAGGLVRLRAEQLQAEQQDKIELEKGSRFEGSGPGAKRYRERYFKSSYFRALQLLQPIVEEQHGLRLTEVMLRWLQHHSELKETDGVILGASSKEQLVMNCEDRCVHSPWLQSRSTD